MEIDGVAKSIIEHCEHPFPAWTLHMRTFGEAGTVKIGKNGNIGDRRCTIIYIGHADGRAGDVYCMWNKRTNKYPETKDVIWLNCMFYKKEKTSTMRTYIKIKIFGLNQVQLQKRGGKKTIQIICQMTLQS